ncbi:hypothetical protein [Vulcanimicrobium alpinum]|uniref:hypothetical protein n=1 Tax=Vulcanimicrobium alpinum TaxID=3016050 RepID=UPI00295EBBCF|nr:hypothetical protein [Vulcanimicrobium alpinum]
MTAAQSLRVQKFTVGEPVVPLVQRPIRMSVDAVSGNRSRGRTLRSSAFVKIGMRARSARRFDAAHVNAGFIESRRPERHFVMQESELLPQHIQENRVADSDVQCVETGIGEVYLRHRFLSRRAVRAESF